MHERFIKGQALTGAEKMVAMMFMSRVFQSFKRICAHESIDSQSIFRHAQRDLLHAVHMGDTSSRRYLEDGTPKHHNKEL